MKNCCYQHLQIEMYARKEGRRELMVNGQTLNCPDCNSEMICETGDSGKLRWGMPKLVTSEQ